MGYVIKTDYMYMKVCISHSYMYLNRAQQILINGLQILWLLRCTTNSLQNVVATQCTGRGIGVMKTARFYSGWPNTMPCERQVLIT